MQVCQSYAGMSKLCRYVNDNRVCQSYTGMPKLCRYVKIIRVYQTSRVWRTFVNFWVLSHFQESVKSRECQTFNLKAYITEMLNMSHFSGNVHFQGYVTPSRECLTFKKLFNFQLPREIQTFKEISAYKGMSHFHGNIKLSRKCQDSRGNVTFSKECHTFKRVRHTFKEMSNCHGIQGNISFQWNVTFSWEC